MAIWTVLAGQSIAAAINAAAPGDEIRIESGVTHSFSPIEFPTKPSGAAIRIRPTAFASLPDRRIAPGDVSVMPTLVCTSGASPFYLQTGRNNWHFDGLNFLPNPGGTQDLIQLSGSQFGGQNDNIRIERCMIDAGASEQKRFLYASGVTNLVFTRSYIAGIHQAGVESTCMTSEFGAGPYTITDNFFEAASISVLFGGGSIPGGAAHIPADIIFQNNHCFKRLSWLGAGFAVKNLFEIKAGKRASISGNVFENCWTDGQSGWAIQFTTVNQFNDAPYAVIEDVTFERNTVKGTERGINFLGTNYAFPTGRMRRMVVRNNLVICSINGIIIQGEVQEITLDHNTFDNDGIWITFSPGDVWPADEGLSGNRPALYAVRDLICTNNLAYGDQAGVFGGSQGTAALAANCVTYVFLSNVLAGEGGIAYPATTQKPTISAHEANFESAGSGMPGFDAASHAQGSGVTSLTWPHTNAGNYIRVNASTDWGGDVTGGTYGGVPLVKLTHATRLTGGVSAPSVRAEYWYLTNPPIGTHNVVLNFSLALEVKAGAVSRTNVNTSAPHGTVVTNAGEDATPTSTAASASTELVEDVVAVKSNGDGISVGAGQTARVDQAHGQYDLGMSEQTGAASTEMSWSVDGGGSRIWASISVPLMPASATVETYRLIAGSAYRNAGTDTLDLGVVWDEAANFPPVVSAGADQNVTLPALATLTGTVTDDGQPSGTLTQLWTKVSGPGTVTFGTPTLPITTAAFSEPGVYVCRLTGSDGALTAFDEVAITVAAAVVVVIPPPVVVGEPSSMRVVVQLRRSTRIKVEV